MAATEPVDPRAGDDPRLAKGILSRRISVVRHLVGVGQYAYLWRTSPEKLAALCATMATGEINFAERYSPSLSSGPERPASELPEPDLP